MATLSTAREMTSLPGQDQREMAPFGTKRGDLGLASHTHSGAYHHSYNTAGYQGQSGPPGFPVAAFTDQWSASGDTGTPEVKIKEWRSGEKEVTSHEPDYDNLGPLLTFQSDGEKQNMSANDSYDIRWTNRQSEGGAKVSEVSDVGVSDSGSHVWRGGEAEERAGERSGVRKQPVSGKRVAVASWQEMGNDVSSARGSSASRARALQSGKKHWTKARGKHRKDQITTVSHGEGLTGSEVRTEQHEMVMGVRTSGQSAVQLKETTFVSSDIGDNRDGKSADTNNSTHRTSSGPHVPGQSGPGRGGATEGIATITQYGNGPWAPASQADQPPTHRQKTEQEEQTSPASSRQVKAPLATLCVPASSGAVTSPAIIVTPASPDGQWSAGSVSTVHIRQGMAGQQKPDTTMRQTEVQVVDCPSFGTDAADTQVKTDPSDIKWTRGSTIRSPPVGAVKVLPSAFTFNMKKFRDTNKSQVPGNHVSSGQRENDETFTILTSEQKQIKETTQSRAAKTNEVSGVGVTDSGRIVTSPQPSTPATSQAASSYTVTTTTVVTFDPAADNSDRVPAAGVTVKGPSLAMRDNTNDTSVLSRPSPGVAVSGKECTTSTSTSEITTAHRRDVTGKTGREQPAVSQPSAPTSPPPVSSPKSTKSVFVKNSEYKVITRSGQATPQSAGAVGVVVSPTHVTTDTEEIYAVPIPKHQRPPVLRPQNNISISGQDQSLPPVAPGPSLPPPLPPPPLLTSEEVPPMKSARPPPKESTTTPDRNHQSGGFTDVTLKNHVSVASQMKKSTTTGMLHSSTHDSHNLSRSTSTGYDYFSLGRRPKRRRVPTLTDSRGMALSLDMLLKSRRQSTTDVRTSCQTPEQSLSVDDILKSCEEYDPNQPLYRSRSRSEITKKSPFPFTQAAHVRLVSPGTEEKSRLKRPASPRPSRKKLNQSVTYEESEDDDVDTPDVIGPVTSRSPTCDGQRGHKMTATVVKEAKTSKSDKFSPVTPRPGQSVDTQDTRSKVNGGELDVRSRQSAANILKTETKKQNGQTVPGGAAGEMSSACAASGQVRSQTTVKSSETHATTQAKKSIAAPIPQCTAESTKSVVTNGQGADHPEKVSVSPKTRLVHTQNQQIADSGQYVTLTSRSVSSSKDKRTKLAETTGDVPTTKSQPSHPSNQLSATVNSVTSHPSPSPSASTSTARSAREVKVSTVLAEDVGVPHVIVTSANRGSEPAPLHQPLSQHSSPPANNNNNNTLSRDVTLSSSSDPISPVSVNSDTSDVMARPSSGASLSLEISMDGGYSGDSPSLGRRSPNHAAKLEAAEALKWLRAAGFPQYAQMFDDGLFPVDLSIVERDHDFLDKDSLQSLFRRLETLNKHAGMKLDTHPRKKAASEEEDEDDLCALSERWEYQKTARRWSRKDLNQQNSPQPVSVSEVPTDLGVHSGSHDSLLADQDSETGDSPSLQAKMPHQEDVVDGKNTSQVRDDHGPADSQVSSPISPRLRRVASERIKTAKNLFKKMEGLKSKKSRRGPNQRNIVEISGPVVADRADMQAKLDRLNCVDISSDSSSPSAGVKNRSERGSSTDNTKGVSSPEGPLSPTSPSPHSAWTLREQGSRSTDDTNTDLSGQDSALRSRQNPAGQSPTVRPMPSTATTAHTTPSTHDSSLGEYYSAQSTLLHNLQTTQPRGAGSSVKKNNSDTNLMEIFLLPQDHQPGRFPRMLQNGYIETEASGTAVNARTGSLRLGRDTGVAADQHRSHTAMASNSADRSRSSGKGNRISMYDNFSPPDGKRGGGVVGGGEGQGRSVIPGITELGLPGSAGQEAEAAERSESDVSGSKFESRESSVLGTSESVSREESRERSVSFQSSPQGSARETTPSSEEGTVLRDPGSRTSAHSSTDSSGRSRGVPHSASADSYFQETESVSDPSSSQHTSTGTLQQDYDEFDQILQQLYQNINDLSRYMNTNTDDRPPRLSSLSTEPPPSTYTREQPLHVATPTTLPVSMSRSQAFDLDSPTSDLMMSPASPLSPHMANESSRLGGGISELFQGENSSSGGEGSNTAESGSEDAELVLTDLSHDDSLDQIPELSRDRRDSGVGHSLTRAPSERRRKKIRWHSFQRCHRPDINSRAMQVNSLTVGQLVRLQKLSLLKLTGIMEKCLPVNKSGWNWMMPRFMKRHKAPDFSEKNVFGVPLTVMAQRTGQPLPQCVLYAMRYLRRTSQNAVGIFRKSGVKSKIQQLRDHLEAHPDTTDFEGINAYNVADMLKTYFRDLPECLLTTKMSETFRSIYTHVPQLQRLEAIQAAILLLPDENREVLQSILLFLSDISTHEADHQMNASNLAVCFTPTVFQLGTRQMSANSPKRNRKHSPGIPDPREILEQKAAHECLLMMITECKKLFTVPSNLFRQLQVQSLAHLEPTPLQDIGNSPSEVRAFGQDRIQMVLKEAHDKNRGWVHSLTVNDVEIYHRKPLDDCPLKEWKLLVDIEAPPIEVLRRIMHERHTWDEDLLSWSVMERLDPFSDIFQFVLNSMAPHPSRHFCVLRYWRSDLTKGACALITMSVEPSDAMDVQGVVAVDLGSYFLMEPCGSGRSRLTYITRIDSRGRTPEWYTKIFGHLCANFLERLKESFKQDAMGPETKV